MVAGETEAAAGVVRSSTDSLAAQADRLKSQVDGFLSTVRSV
jgi:hypothetical protein